MSIRRSRVMTNVFRAAIAVMGAMVLCVQSANAAITVFGSNVFSESAVTGSSSALGVPDASGATVTDGGELVLQFLQPLTGAGISFDLLAGGGTNVIAVSIGEVVGGVATFSATSFIHLGDGLGATIAVADLSAACASVSASGCSLLRFQNILAVGAPGFVLDGVSGVSNAPEPAVWSLMILGFVGAAWRLKIERRRKPAGLVAA